MELEVAKSLIKKYTEGHQAFIMANEVANRYYKVQNDILMQKPKKEEVDNPLRSADNRIAHSFYNLLVNQKAAYMFTAPPIFDVKDDALNTAIVDALGDGYAKKAKDLCVNACNAGVAWVHYWNEDGEFQWAVVSSDEVIPIFSKRLDKELVAALRVYTDIDETEGKLYTVYEYWNDTACESFRREASVSVDEGLQLYNSFSWVSEGTEQESNVYMHELGAVPFIPFYNNNIASRDLDLIKRLIDAYDKTYSGFMNDLEDIQEVIFILTNYGGEDKAELLRDLKYYKAVQFDSIGGDDKSGLSTLTIEIPVEARDKMLEITRKAIFDMGQGIDPQQQGLDGTSGEAMKFLYSLLELKAGMTETEFRLGFNRLVRAICLSKGKDIGTITQTWTRTSIRNDAELVDMCSKSMGVISRKTILKNHPFVESAEDEEKELHAEETEDYFEGQETSVKTDGGNNDET